MPKRSVASKPTDTECTILSAIWRRGSATVRQVYQDLQDKHGMGYTTVLKFMQIMTEKGLLTRDTSVRPQVYQASQSKMHTQKKLVRDLLDRAFGGSPGNLALQALSLRKATTEELNQVRALLDELEEEAA